MSEVSLIANKQNKTKQKSIFGRHLRVFYFLCVQNLNWISFLKTKVQVFLQ